jgi:hypothetical protein
VCERWVVKETQEADIIHSDNDSEASPNITEFEAFLEQDLAPREPPPNVEPADQRKRKKLSKTDEFWEGVLASEKLRLQKVSDSDLTPVEAMMVGSSSEEETGDTPLRRAAKRRAKAILRSINDHHGGSLGPSPPL